MRTDQELLDWTISEMKLRLRRGYERNLAYKRCIAEGGLQSLINALVMGAWHGPKKREDDDPEYWEHHAINIGFNLGAKRGTEKGADAAELKILEARKFARNKLEQSVPWLDDEPEDN